FGFAYLKCGTDCLAAPGARLREAERLCQSYDCAAVRGLRKTSSGAGSSDSRSATCVKAACSADLSQAGSVRAASPAKAKAWQRQPPQSTSRNSQERQGSRIQDVPR